MKLASVIFFFFILSIVFMNSANAANEYMQGGGMSCSQGSIEPYAEFSNRDGTQGSFYTDNGVAHQFLYPGGETDDWRAGVRLRWELGSSCSKKARKLMLENEQLKQQFELLKLCGRYKNVELGEEFATVRNKCAGIVPKEVPEGMEDGPDNKLPDLRIN